MNSWVPEWRSLMKVSSPRIQDVLLSVLSILPIQRPFILRGLAMGHSSVSRVTKRELTAFVGRESIEAERSEHVGRTGHWFSRVAQSAGLRVGGGNEVRQVAKARAACNEKRKSDVSGEVADEGRKQRGKKRNEKT